MQNGFKNTGYCFRFIKLMMFVILFAFFNSANAQYYIKGDVKDQFGDVVQNAQIYIPSKRAVFYSGREGGFGIPSAASTDSLVFSKLGYDSLKIVVNAREYQNISLRKIVSASQKNTPKLVSLTLGPRGFLIPAENYKAESYSNLVENDFTPAGARWNTSFAMRIDKASYSNIRRFINQNTRVPADAVRIEEMLNYFNLNYLTPAKGEVFSLQTKVSDCPWNPQHLLLYLTLSAKKIDLSNVPPSNLVFLIDVSGSMDQPQRLPLLKEAFQLMIENLRDIDTVSIVTYGGSVGIKLPPTGGNKKEKISRAIEELVAAGDTPGEAALRTAYQVARNTFMKNGNNRIILATDGDFNVGQTSDEELENLIHSQRKDGIFLTCLGVGMGNYKDSKIEILARKGNGNFAYIDDIAEAQKVLVTEFAQNMYSVASDVINTIAFDSTVIKEYRLLGYDNKKSVLNEEIREIEGGEIGSGSVNTILFELVPVDLINIKNSTSKLADFSLSYKEQSAGNVKREFELNVNYVPFHLLDTPLQFCTAVAMFGIKLRGSDKYPPIENSRIIQIASGAVDGNETLQLQFIDIVEKSASVYHERKGKRKKRN